MKLSHVDIEQLISSEISYIGSFFQEKEFKRQMDFFANRAKVMNAEDMHDKLSVSILKAVTTLNFRNEAITYENMGNILLNEGYIQQEDSGILEQVKTWESLKDVLKYYAERGATKLKQFRLYENAVENNWRTDKLDIKNIEKIIRDATNQGLNSSEVAFALREYAESLLSTDEMVAVRTDETKQKEFLENYPEQQKQLIGKPRFTFPPHWNLNKNIPVIKPGQIITLAGDTGGGKSSMAMQFAEFSYMIGKNVLVIHMEDMYEIIGVRQTVRWVGGTLEELERGDPRNRMVKMAKLKEEWAKNGGSIDYRYLAGFDIDTLKGKITEYARELELVDKHLDLVVFDYFQKADHDRHVKNGQNLASVNAAGVEKLKIHAEKLAYTLMIVSQETADADGGKHTAWTKALEQKAQIYISLTRKTIKEKEEEYVNITNRYGIIEKVSLALAGDRSVWVELNIKKVNQGKTGIVWLYFDGPRFRAIDPDFMKRVESGEVGEFNIPVLKPSSPEFLEHQDLYLQKYEQGWKQLKDPVQKRKEKSEQSKGRREVE